MSENSGMYAVAKKAERLNATQNSVADGLQAMAESVDAQDKVIKKTLAIATDAVKVADNAHTIAMAAQGAAGDVLVHVNRFEHMSIVQKLQWFFRGPIW